MRNSIVRLGLHESTWVEEVPLPARDRTALTRSRRQYVQQPLPGFLEFLHPKVVTEPPTGAHWLHEMKFDGYRFQARIADGAVSLFTRRGHDWTDKLPELAANLSALPDCILDG